MHPVTIENDAFRMEVWPTIGGKVSSIIDKSDNYEMLYTFPSELPDSPRYDARYAEQWYCGWDECFPTIASGPYPHHPYTGIAVPDHGELWGIPTTAAVPTKNGITTVWHGLRFGYRLTRKLYLQDASIIAEYDLSNLAPFDFHFVWAMHCLMSMAQSVELSVEQKSFRFSHNNDGKRFDTPFSWPAFSETENFSRPDSLPIKQGWKLFSTEPIHTPFLITYPNRNRSIRVQYQSEDNLAAYWGVWINIGGWASTRHFAIEPTTGRFDDIDRSLKDGSSGKIDPFGRRRWSLRWTIS
jgi:hypothetical protein